jgi:hypothetical protein
MIQECGNGKVKETWKNNTSVSKTVTTKRQRVVKIYVPSRGTFK